MGDQVIVSFVFFLMIRRPPRSTQGVSSAASDVYKRQVYMYSVVIPLLLCGCAYCFYVSGLWPSIPYVVDKKMLGSAYGITTAIQNIGLATGPLIVSAFIDDKVEGSNYRFVNFIQIIGSTIGLGFGVWLWIYDVTKNYSILSANSADALRIQKQIADELRASSQPIEDQA
eukprot:TRINITY_DN1681_c0_g1_i1.p1 TRINITY_DN1681_c0_g1~~TRINITY_DN1681_c0_g1_i1.p1  ORF type:complete len:171 (+),score=27.23 TRINITY_DN1681_c0_g1_i1:69-581(+)